MLVVCSPGCKVILTLQILNHLCSKLSNFLLRTVIIALKIWMTMSLLLTVGKGTVSMSMYILHQHRLSVLVNVRVDEIANVEDLSLQCAQQRQHFLVVEIHVLPVDLVPPVGDVTVMPLLIQIHLRREIMILL